MSIVSAAAIPVAKLVADLVEHIGLCHTPSWLGGGEPFSKLPPGDRYPACDQPESADSSGPVGLLTTHRLEPKLLLREPFSGSPRTGENSYSVIDY
jgi:hypothetical protein